MSSRRNGEADEDCQFLEQVLDKLYDFGDKKKKSQKKKKRKRCEEEEEEEEEFPTVKDECSGSDHGDQAMQAQSQHTGPSVQQVEVVVFQDPRKKLITQKPAATDPVPAPPITEKKPSVQPEELSLEKARLEVHRFGISGYKKEQQRVFEQDRAVMLGARPPKKEYVNYKQLQQQLKEKKQKAKEEVQPELKKKKKQNNQSRDKKKAGGSSGAGGAPTGQVGRFKNGMLVLSSKEIQKIKGNMRRN